MENMKRFVNQHKDTLKSTGSSRSWFVWNDIPINSIKISPIWLRYLRVSFKILCIPFGKSNWHKFDRKFIFFCSEVLGLYSLWSYVDLIKEKMQFRNAQSWFARDCLNKKAKELFKKIIKYK